MSDPRKSWRKSSYSNGGTGSCVEVAISTDEVAVRDSKHTAGPTIAVNPAAWQEFLSTTRG
jgi:hypothetical protein